MAAALSLTIIVAPQTRAQDQSQDQGSKQAYTMPEYNAYQVCAAEKDPNAQIKCLDDFVSKYPNSALLGYAYPLYVQAYGNLRNFPKEIEYVDKLLELNGAKMDALARTQAYYARAQAFVNIATPTADQATKARDAAQAGLKSAGEMQKPANVSDDDWAKQTTSTGILFNYVIAKASVTLKDTAGAIEGYKAILKLTPDDAVTEYQLGQAYSSMNPPQQMDAFWWYARAVTSKNAKPDEAAKIKTYLRKLVANYQQASCDSLVDAEFNELLQLAGSSPDRPATYKLPSSAELQAAQKDMTIASVMADLKAGGDKGKVTWLAACGLEFPDVPGKLIELVPGGGDVVELKEAFVTSQEQFDSAKVADLDVKIVGQPEAAKLEVGSEVRFTATLVSYDPDPNFMLHWDKGKVNAEDLPKEKKTTPRKKSGSN
jgi:tetratricopeptide (TPR) repeat protein